MYRLEDYLYFRGDISFGLEPVNEIDELVFASMGKADFSEVLENAEEGKYSELFKEFYRLQNQKKNKSLGLLESPHLMPVLKAIAESPRYADIRISHFVNRVSTELTEQMSALTVFGPDNRIYVTYRGTDDTLVGWKENCELAILESVPGQRDALEYLETIAAAFEGPIVLCGHSKGGNLAIYAASKTTNKVCDRIEKIISYDGPGFFKEFYETPGYQKIKDRIHTLVPKSSLVGMLMEYAGSLEVIDCEAGISSSHDYFLWSLGKHELIRTDELSDASRVFHQAISQALEKMDIDERQELVDEIFEVLSSTGAERLLDFTEHSARQAFRIAGRFNKSKEIKQFILMMSRLTFRDAMSNTIEGIQGKIKDSVTGKREIPKKAYKGE